MIHLVKKMCVNTWSIVAMLILFASSTLKADSLTPTELHATMGIVTNFILSDYKIIHNGKDYGIVTSPYTDRIWLDRNLGASQVCTSYDDVNCYGDYYQWGRNFDGHEDFGSATTVTQAANVTTVGHSDFITSGFGFDFDWAQAVDATGATRTANWSKTDGSSVCPVGFRVPNIAELKAETLDNGVTDRDTAFTNFLKLPSAGYHNHFSGSMNDVGSWGYVWASSVVGSNSHYVYFGSGNAVWGNGFRAKGYSVRCLRD